MIGYLEGALMNMEEDRILLRVDHVGYEVLLPAFVMETLRGKNTDDPIALYIYYHQTERQPKPVLIGFNLEAEKAFFQMFLTVEAIGPLKAVKAMTMPIRDMARAIETKDTATLGRLKGVGNRTAQKIVATLEGKVGKFALIRKDEQPEATPPQSSEDFIFQVMDVLVNQLGHKRVDAQQLIDKALKRNPAITSAEGLFDEVYRGEIAQ